MDGLRRAIELLGSQTALAEKLGKKQGHVWAWLNKHGGRVPAELVIPIEAATNGQVTREELRPDLYPPPDDMRMKTTRSRAPVIGQVEVPLPKNKRRH